ncbi:hypothetical protein [Stakelama marina]|uniref:Uncharacterized protein n=1 Tax=Stakelama marina TaxID=2826939 RepID=A0A8T4ICQ4_9SPHN|nr:hypothetical protein [Stakelama marina]MBR0552253.1 hypothetical protein [Stakelama marina]
MNKLTLMIAGLGIATAALPATASAAPWQSVNQRQANIERRIDVGVRSGSLDRREARSLRIQYRRLVRLEARYRSSGHRLTRGERRILERRYDALSRQVARQRHDRQHRRYASYRRR